MPSRASHPFEEHHSQPMPTCRRLEQGGAAPLPLLVSLLLHAAGQRQVHIPEPRRTGKDGGSDMMGMQQCTAAPGCMQQARVLQKKTKREWPKASRGVGSKAAGAARAPQVASRLPARVGQLQLRCLADGAGQVECGACAARAAAAAGGGGGGRARPGGCRCTATSLRVCRLLRCGLGPDARYPASILWHRKAQ